MRPLPDGLRTLTGILAAAVLALGITGCSGILGKAGAADLAVGDCLKVGGAVDRPEATKVACGSTESNFKVVSTVADSEQCPTDVDSYYSQHSTFSDESTTVCMDIDWVVGGCMSVDPEHDSDPVRVDCADNSKPNRQRATQILTGVAIVDECASGLGYAYDEREFTVCVEDVR
ncbi:hypothetical protein BH09ACT7_BH09ACT7_49190 [soil metagenome]